MAPRNGINKQISRFVIVLTTLGNSLLSCIVGSKGANQYEQFGIIRFELPFDCWCLKCNRHMCKGLRFNAKKDRDGKYFSTTIWSFKMKCYDCDQHFIIKTDPKNSTYDLVEGIRQMEQEFQADIDDSIIEATTDEQREKLTSDPIFRLQHEKEDLKKAENAKSQLSLLLNMRETVSRNDYDSNSNLRNEHRKRKRRANELLAEGKSLGLSIPLVEPNLSDSHNAKLVKFKSNIHNKVRNKELKKYLSIQSQSIFHHDDTCTDIIPFSSDSTSTKSNVIQTSSELKKEKRKQEAIQHKILRRIDTKNMKLSEKYSNNIIPSDSSFPHFEKGIKRNNVVTKHQNVTGDVTKDSNNDNSISVFNMLSGYASDNEKDSSTK